MYVLVSMLIWASGHTSSETIGQFQEKAQCLTAKAAMEKSMEKFDHIEAIHRYECEPVPAKQP